jgi:oligoendopeptidase F
MLACVRRYEAIDVTAGRIMSFAGLRYYQNTMDSDRAKFMADAQDRVTGHHAAGVLQPGIQPAGGGRTCPG